jgi:hypothetical protein
LVRLNLFCNPLAGKIPQFVGGLLSLEVLQLCENNFRDGILANLSVAATGWKIVDVSTNRLTDVLPIDLCADAQLQTFITLGNSPSHLTRIQLGENYINGAVLAKLFTLTNLTSRRLSCTTTCSPTSSSSHP